MNAQEVDVVWVPTDDKGNGFHEPPCTEEEEMEFYRRVGGAKELTIYRSHRPGAAGKQAPTKQPQQEEGQ
jgi:hypothetical protein